MNPKKLDELADHIFGLTQFAGENAVSDDKVVKKFRPDLELIRELSDADFCFLMFKLRDKYFASLRSDVENVCKKHNQLGASILSLQKTVDFKASKTITRKWKPLETKP